MEQFPQLEGKRLPWVVIVGLERHPENADRLVLQRMAFLQSLHNAVRQPLVDQHRRMPKKKTVVTVCGQLHRVLEQTRPRRKTRRGKTLSPRILICYGIVNPVEIKSLLDRDLIKLVRDRELYIAPHVGEDLRQLRLKRIEN